MLYSNRYIVKRFCHIQGSLGQSISTLTAMYPNMALYLEKKQCPCVMQVMVTFNMKDIG